MYIHSLPVCGIAPYVHVIFPVYIIFTDNTIHNVTTATFNLRQYTALKRIIPYPGYVMRMCQVIYNLRKEITK
jgi:hypothetical protein